MTYPNKTITVADNLHYAKIGQQVVLINEEVTDFTETTAFELADKHFIGEKQKRSNAKSVSASIAYTAALNPSDPFSMFLYTVGKDRQIGEQFEEYEVETWNKVEDGVFAARKRVFEVQPSNPGSGAAGADLTMAGVLAQQGGVVKGKFNIATKTFTATTTTA